MEATERPKGQRYKSRMTMPNAAERKPQSQEPFSVAQSHIPTAMRTKGNRSAKMTKPMMFSPMVSPMDVASIADISGSISLPPFHKEL